MVKNPKVPLFFSLLICTIYFFLFYFPNRSASENLQMVAVFEPDEAVPLPYMLDMIKPADTFKHMVINFLSYDYYFYGYPYFAYSAGMTLPLIPLNLIHSVPIIMITLRQLVSVLPMLAAVMVLVYLQTRFNSYKAYVLLIFLLSIPAVVQNNLWWHPDSLAILFAMLTIFFLDRDKLRFKLDYYLAAVMCGISAGIKGIGLYFFLTIFVYLLIGWLARKRTIIQTMLSGMGYLVAMCLSYLVSNPLLVYPGIRQKYFEVMREQFNVLKSGYEVIYQIGLIPALKSAMDYFGHWLIWIAILGVCIWGIIRGPNRLLQTIILTWAIPVSVLVFGVIHFKYQYWLPVFLPLFSCLATILPEKSDIINMLSKLKRKVRVKKNLSGCILIIVIIQVVNYGISDFDRINQKIHATELNPAIPFYSLAINALEPLIGGSYYVYHDVRMYVPETPGWVTDAIFELLDYDYLKMRNFDVVMLMQERINDYLNPNIIGLDSEAFTRSQIFYEDANLGKLQGYHLVYRNNFGLVFVKEQLFESEYNPQE